MTEAVTVNGVSVEAGAHPSPEVAAVHELLRQRASAIGLIGAAASTVEVARAIEQLLEREVTVPVPGEDECRRFYEAHKDNFHSGDLAFVRHILFQVVPGAPIDRVRAKAEETLGRVAREPKAFEDAARTLSNCPSAQQGGNLGQLTRGETVPEFDQAVFGDGWIGVLPRLVKTRYGFHVVSIDRRIEGSVLPFEAVRKRIAEALTARVQQTALRQYVRLLAGQAEIRGVDLDPADTPLVQ